MQRFEIWDQSRTIMQEYKLQAYEQYESLKKEMGENIRKKLE
jgi:hypothetical protein